MPNESTPQEPYKIPSQVTPEMSRRSMAAVAELSEQNLRDNYNAEQVVHFARTAGYDLTAELLDKLVALRRVLEPVEGSWDARGLHSVIAFLEMNRVWQPESRLHHVKKSFARKMREADGIPTVDRYSLLSLLTWLATQNDRDEREVFLETAIQKLTDAGVDLFA